MHEVGIVEQLLEAATESARDAGARRIHRIKTRVGDLSGVVPEALQFAFDILAEGTIAESAIFEIERVTARCYCPRCDRVFQPDDWIYTCPRCHRLSSQILRGKELELTSLEVS